MALPVFSPPLPFIDLNSQRERMGKAVDDAVLRVVHHGGYIMGPEVAEVEAELSRFCGARHTLSCANGTDALALLLMAWKVRPGDAIFCPSFTFAATAEVVAWLGATPIFVDIDADTFNMNMDSLRGGLATAASLGVKPVGVISVDLFGQPADYDPIEAFCGENGLWLLCDAAQSFGAEYKGRKVGTIGQATATSFFPAKPLGCYGDGGAVFTDDDGLMAILKSLRVHGQGTDKYDNIHIGMNGRLDTMQAAVLLEKLRIFADEIRARDAVARRYSEGLADIAAVPRVAGDRTSVWAQYTLLIDEGKRAEFIATLKAAGIPTAIYYPKPLHRQQAYKRFPVVGNGLPVSDRVAGQVVSLPMHPYLEPDVQDGIIANVRAALGH